MTTKIFKVNHSQDAMIIKGVKSTRIDGFHTILTGHLTVIFTRNGEQLRKLARTVWMVRNDLTMEIN